MTNECIEYDLNKITHLFEGEDIIIEIPRNDDSLKLRVRSEKVHELAARTLGFSTPMGLAFEHARGAGSREREKKLLKWWGSEEKDVLPIKELNKHFECNDLPPTEKHWVVTRNDVDVSSEEFDVECSDKNELVESSINSVNDLIDNETVLIRSCDNNSRNVTGNTLSNIDNWFDQLLKDQIERSTKNDASCNKANSDVDRSNKELKLVIEKTP